MSTATLPATVRRDSPPSTSIVPMSHGTEAVQSAIEQLKSLRSFVKQELVADVDFGVIPGTGTKPVLLLPGAQKTALYFNCTARFKHRRTELGNGHLEVESLCLLRLRSSGTVVSEGSGTCSTMESKYRTRKAERVCPECGKAAIIKGKQEYGGGWVCFKKKDGCGAKFGDGDRAVEDQAAGRVDNPDIWDQRNTVLKMAAKRAMVAAALNLGAMSELFTQDIEDTYEPAPAHEPARHQEPDPREAINAEFRPAAESNPKRDNRPFHQLVADACEFTAAEFKKAFPAATTKLPGGYQVARRLYKFALGAGYFVGAEPPKTNRDVMEALSGLHGVKEGRKLLRAELRDYLAEKLQEARQRAFAEATEAAARNEAEDDARDEDLDRALATVESGEDYEPGSDG